MKARICLIEDDAIMGEAIVERFDIEGYACDWFQRGREAQAALANERYALVVSDIRLPDISGERLFEELRATAPSLPPFLFITAHGAIDQAVRLLKLGAEDYLTKPLDIPLMVQKVRTLCGRAAPEETGTPTLGISSAMRRIKDMLPRIASMLPRVAVNVRTVLITGESGVGKEVVARALHDAARAGKEQPFVAVNCGAITESLMEAELFGHEKGAFTGAIKERRGAFEQADGGTLFLDEIGDMPLAMQVKLLRTIQERQVVRVGSEKSIPVDFRLICATHRDIKKMVQEGTFREDLYYRVLVVTIDIPPLRDRREDILWLADQFLSEFPTDGVTRYLDASAESAILSADWPGNVRQLRHTIERACILNTSQVLNADALLGVADTTGIATIPRTLPERVAASERRLIIEALVASNGHLGDTAQHLGISRKNLWEKMKKHGIGPLRDQEDDGDGT